MKRGVGSRRPGRGQAVTAWIVSVALCLSMVPLPALAETDTQKSQAASDVATTEPVSRSIAKPSKSQAASDVTTVEPSHTEADAADSSKNTAQPSAQDSNVESSEQVRRDPVQADSQAQAVTNGTGTAQDTSPEQATVPETPKSAADIPDTDPITATIEVIGPDAVGNDTDWLQTQSVEYSDGKTHTAEELTKITFGKAGLTADIQESSTYGAFLKSITSPFDGKVYQFDNDSGKYWQLFFDGKPSQEGMSSIDLSQGTTIVWYYSTFGVESTPDARSLGDNPVKVDPTAKPDSSVKADWGGFANGGSSQAVVEDSAPDADDVKPAWDKPFHVGMGASDPIIAGGSIYMVGDGNLMKIDEKTGKLQQSVKIANHYSYFCRPAYVDGSIVIPFDDGSLRAYTANDLKLAWCTPRLDTKGTLSPDGFENLQALSSVSVGNKRILTAFSDIDYSSREDETGILVSTDLNGENRWHKAIARDRFYWCGAVHVDDNFIIGDQLGNVYLLNGKDGKELSRVSLGTSINSTIGKVSDDTFAVSDTAGTLHILKLQKGKLSEIRSVHFANKSTSSPVAAGTVVFVGGLRGQTGVVAAIDTADASSAVRVINVGEGEVQSTPLVVQSGSDLSIYVTLNHRPGGIYVVHYREGILGPSSTLYVPQDKTYQNWCTASPVMGKDGTLYYTNDSGYLFALKRGTSGSVFFDAQDGSSIGSIARVKLHRIADLPVPYREGYTFTGWSFDKEGKSPLGQSLPASGATLYAQWKQNATDSGSSTDSQPGGNNNNAGGSGNQGNGQAPMGNGFIPVQKNPRGFGGGVFFGAPSAAIGSPASNANVASSSAAPAQTQQTSDQKEDSAGTSGSLLGQHGNTSNSQQADGHSGSDNAGGDVSSSENSSLPGFVIPIIGIIAGVIILIAAFHNSNKKRTYA